MPETNIKNKSVSEIWSIIKPNGRFNNWGERKWIGGIPIEKQDSVNKELSHLNLSPRATELYRAAKLTDSKGVEFVLFSDAQFSAPIRISNGGILIPCFAPLDPFNPYTEDRQAAMMNRGVFIYDGWIPNEEWSPTWLENTISLLDNIVSLFSVVGKYHAFWEPKYKFYKPPVPSQLFYQHDLQALAYSMNIMDVLPEGDREVLSRSVAWISSALRNSAIPKFLLLFVSVESLATYIESSSTEKDSKLKQTFADNQPSKSERRTQREDCIRKVQQGETNLTSSIERAYSECVRPSIRKMLEDHLNRIFGDDSVSNIMFKDEVEGKTLWLLRNDIAHGSLNMLSEQETLFIARRVDILEEIARNYLRRIFTGLADKNYFPATRRPILTIPVSQGVGSIGVEYEGPTDMAEYYLKIEALSSSYVRVTF